MRHGYGGHAGAGGGGGERGGGGGSGGGGNAGKGGGGDESRVEAEFPRAAMEILEPLAEKYGLFVAERSSWRVEFRGPRRTFAVGHDPWTPGELGARIGVCSERYDEARPRAVDVLDVLHLVHGVGENTRVWAARSPAELRGVLLSVAGLVDRYCADLLLDDEAFRRAEERVRRVLAEREAFRRLFEGRLLA